MKTIRTFWILKALKFTVLFALVGVIMTYAVMLLWNWLMPSVFSVAPISFWQALGILILAKLLFGFGRGWQGGHWHHRHYYGREKMEERLKNLSPEERERFREDWRKRCGRWKHYDWGEEKKESEEMKTE